jgi:hypothetical protein
VAVAGMRGGTRAEQVLMPVGNVSSVWSNFEKSSTHAHAHAHAFSVTVCNHCYVYEYINVCLIRSDWHFW